MHVRFRPGRSAPSEDPRRSPGLRYPLPLVVISALLAAVAGTDDAQSMQYWSELHEDGLAEFLDVLHGVAKGRLREKGALMKRVRRPQSFWVLCCGFRRLLIHRPGCNSR